MRYTKSEIVGMFNRLCRAMNKTPGFQLGQWSLDYSSVYGGYVIEEAMESGGVDHPLGLKRRTASEMYLSLHMAACAAEMIQQKKKQ